MKKIILIAGAALICSCVIGCASAPAKPETAAQVSGTELLDWQGSEFVKAFLTGLNLFLPRTTRNSTLCLKQRTSL